MTVLLEAFLRRVTVLTLLSLFVYLLAGCNTTQQPTALSSAAREEAADTAEEAAKQHLAQNDFAGAVPPLSELARLRPDSADILMMLGTCVLRTPNRQPFLIQARTDLKKDPNDPVALMIAANALPGAENQKERFACLEKLVKLRPDNHNLSLDYAMELVNAHLYTEARPLIESLLKEDATAGMAYFLRGKMGFYEATTPESLKSVVADLQEAIQRNPDFGWSYLLLAQAHDRQNQPKRALDSLKQAALHLPVRPDIWFEQARAYRLLGDKKQALAAEATFHQLRELDLRCTTLVARCGVFPKDRDLHLDTAQALLEKGDAEQAMFFLRRAERLGPADRRLADLTRKAEERIGLQGRR